MLVNTTEEIKDVCGLEQRAPQSWSSGAPNRRLYVEEGG